MSFLNMRTVIFSHVLTDIICVIVLAFLWLQNRSRYKGTFYWLLDLVCQTIAVVLVVLRGSIPDWMSMIVANTLVVTGMLLGYIGLLRFLDRKSVQVHNYLFLVIFIVVHSFFVFVQPDLNARNINLSLGILFLCTQRAWLLLRREGAGARQITRELGLVYLGFSLFSIIRVLVILVNPSPNHDFFQSGIYDTLVLLAYQMLVILMTFMLVLMVNRRLLMGIQAQEHKWGTAFRSAPYAMTITRPSDGYILDVNDGFVTISGYTRDESIGKTTSELHIWADEKERQRVVDELAIQRSVTGQEFQFRIKSGEVIICVFSAQMITIDGQAWILSSINDITAQRQAQAMVQASEERYRGLFDNSFNGVAIHEIVVDENGRPIDYIFLQVNQAFESMTGLRAADILGHRITEVLPGTEDDPFIDIYGRVAQTEEPIRFEQFSTPLNRFYEITAFSMRDGLFATIFRDITEQKQIEDELRANARLLRTIADNYPHAYISIIESDLTVGFSSGQEFRKQALDPQQFTGLSLEQIFGERAPFVREHYLKAFEGQEQAFEMFFNNQHQLYRIVPLYAEDGSIPRILVVVDNITERKQAEQELQAYRDELEKMVEERTRDLEISQARLLQQERLAVLGQLSGGIAHELRAPLSAIKNGAYLLRMDEEKLDSDMQEALAIMDTEIKNAEQIITNLLDFARNRQPLREAMDLNALLSRVLDGIKVPDKVHVHKELAEIPLFNGDPAQLRQVFSNLMRNAIQAMPDGGQLALRTQIENQGWVTVEVSDTGTGIAPENMVRLFEPLYTTKAKGIGLGLALVNMLVDAHGGKIDVHSQLGEGSAFIVRLPLFTEIDRQEEVM